MTSCAPARASSAAPRGACVALVAAVLGSALATLAPLAGCRADHAEVDDGPRRTVDAAPAPAPAPLVVFAASSLRAPFSALGAAFERAHPGVVVTFAFAGTPELRAQLEHGAPADVFAGADAVHVDALVQAGHLQDPVVFARNSLVVVARRGGVDRFESLPEAGRVVLGAPEVPVGRYTLLALDRAGARLGPDFRTRVEAHVVSRELSAAQVLARVRLGEADAGFVYATDVRGADADSGLVALPLPPDAAVDVVYPVAAVVRPGQPAATGTQARAWIALLRSDEGQEALRAAGFLPPG